MAREMTYMPLAVLRPEHDRKAGFVKIPFLVSEKFVVVMDVPEGDAVRLALEILRGARQRTIEEVLGSGERGGVAR